MRIVGPSDCTGLELHLVLGERACLIGEDVVYLSQVLRDVQGAALDTFVHRLVVQLDVAVDEVDLPQFDKLH